MRLLIGLLLLVSLSSAAEVGFDPEYLQGLGDTRYLAIDSDAVGRRYHLYVMLPASYETLPEQRYPVIYVLDGGALFPLITAYSRYLNFGQEIPEAIVVGISYGSDIVEEGNFRSTDYTAPSPEREYWGGAPIFQRFLSDELIPLIDGRFRTRPDRRVIFGHSIGGQFVLYTALTQPALFWGHIASNPALHRNLPFFLKAHATQGKDVVQSKLFVGSGSLDDPRFREPALQWINHWNAEEEKPWRLKTQDLLDHSHMSAPPASFRAGLSWLFSES